LTPLELRGSARVVVCFEAYFVLFYNLARCHCRRVMPPSPTAIAVSTHFARRQRPG
jgi:hypothetical protein